MDSRNWIYFEGLEGFEGSQGILMNSVDFDQNRVPQLQIITVQSIHCSLEYLEREVEATL